MAEQLTPQHFLPHVQKVFRIEGGQHALTLTRVEQRRLEDHETEVGLREPFNLIFRGPPGDVLAQGLYAVTVEDGSSFELYVMPIYTPMREHQNYQASFN